MTRKEYAEKWCKECMNCPHLILHQYHGGPKDPRGNYACCIWSEERMDFMPNDSTCEAMTKVMVMDAKNIGRECPMYTERLMELYNLDD